MSYQVVIHPDLVSTCRKFRSKSPARYEQVRKKIRSLAENPELGKPLHPPLKGLWRVHIGHFILFYETNAPENTIVFLNLVHDDQAYQ